MSLRSTLGAVRAWAEYQRYRLKPALIDQVSAPFVLGFTSAMLLCIGLLFLGIGIAAAAFSQAALFVVSLLPAGVSLGLSYVFFREEREYEADEAGVEDPND